MRPGDPRDMLIGFITVGVVCSTFWLIVGLVIGGTVR
jgi:hypothetical protein